MKVPLPEITVGKTLSERLTHSLRDAILKGYFEPGEKLDPELIAREYGVSRMPVREAFGRLESEGVIELRPHHGAFIPTMSQEDILDTFEIRKLLEAEIVRQAIAVIPDEVLDQMELQQRQALEASGHGDAQTFINADIHFHETLLSYVHNNLFRVVLESMNKRISKVRRVAASQPGPHMVESANEHLLIIAAIRERDSERAVWHMTQHLDHSGKRIKDLAH